MIITGWFLAFGIILALVFWGAWRAYNPRGFALHLLMWGCIVLAVACAVHTTLPSSAPRRHVAGMISWIATHKEGRSSSYTIGFKTEEGQELTLDAAAIPLFFAEGRDQVAVTYLEEKRVGRYPRAIEFRALTGPRAGYDTAVSADWSGPWLGVLLAAVVGTAAIYGANSNKRSPTDSSASSV